MIDYIRVTVDGATTKKWFTKAQSAFNMGYLILLFFSLPSHHLSVDNTYVSITMVSYYAISYFSTNGPINAIQDMKKANI